MSTRVTLRHGIATPVSIDLAPEEVKHITRLSIEDGIEFLLSKTALPVGSIEAFRETLRDPHCIIEMRQGDLVKVLTRREGIGTELVPLRQPGPGLGTVHQPAIEIGLAKAQRGGSWCQAGSAALPSCSQ